MMSLDAFIPFTVFYVGLLIVLDVLVHKEGKLTKKEIVIICCCFTVTIALTVMILAYHIITGDSVFDGNLTSTWELADRENCSLL